MTAIVGQKWINPSNFAKKIIYCLLFYAVYIVQEVVVVHKEF